MNESEMLHLPRFSVWWGGATDLGSGIARVDLSFKTYWKSPEDTPFTTAVRNTFVRGAPSTLKGRYDCPALQAGPYHGNYGPQAGKQDAGAGAGSQGWRGHEGTPTAKGMVGVLTVMDSRVLAVRQSDSHRPMALAN